MVDLKPMTTALRMVGEDPVAVLGPQTAHVVVHGHEVAAVQSLPGVALSAESVGGVVYARVTVAAGMHIGQPVHLCFGLSGPSDRQRVELDLELEPESSATFWSHCLFAQAEDAAHVMNARLALGADASLRYQEVHYHGLSGAIRVVPHAEVSLGPRSRYAAEFLLVQGRVGTLDVDYRVDVGEHALAELTSKIHSFGTDSIRVREQVNLNGEGARGLIKTRLAARDDSKAEVIGITHGNAAGARGHVDCLEIVRDHAVVAARPEVKVTHPQAKVTHEAAIGSIEAKQLETLMARGLTPQQAIDLVVRGMLA